MPGFFKLFLKVLFLVIIVVMQVAESTDADLNDRGIISDNLFSAGTLDISEFNPLDDSKVDNLFNSKGVVSNGYEVKALRLKNLGDMDVLYSIVVNEVLGDQEICDLLQVRVFNNWDQVYLGSLSELSFQSEIENNLSSELLFVVGIDRSLGDLKDATCKFNFEITSWPSSNLSRAGFIDKEIIQNAFFTAK